jgi:drug/metabolite transporter (DMT)-like permease
MKITPIAPGRYGPGIASDFAAPIIAASVIWGSSFLFIRVAVEHMPPSAVVFGRTLPGTAFLLPLRGRPTAALPMPSSSASW